MANANTLFEEKLNVFHILAEVQEPLTSEELSEVLQIPLSDMNQILDSSLNEHKELIIKKENGYHFVGTVDDINEIESSQGEPLAIVDEDENTENKALMGEIAKLLMNKSRMPELTVLKQLKVSEDKLKKAANTLSSRGGLKISELEDFDERIFKRTDKTQSFVNYGDEMKSTESVGGLPATELVEDAKDDFSAPEKSEIETVNEASKSSVEEWHPYVDSAILAYVEKVGRAAKTGISRQVTSEYKASGKNKFGKIGKPRVESRVDELLESGKLELFESESGPRYKISGTTGEEKEVIKRGRKPARAESKATSDNQVTDKVEAIKEDKPEAIVPAPITEQKPVVAKPVEEMVSSESVSASSIEKLIEAVTLSYARSAESDKVAIESLQQQVSALNAQLSEAKAELEKSREETQKWKKMASEF